MKNFALIFIIVAIVGCTVTRPDFVLEDEQTDPLFDKSYGFNFESIDRPFYHTKVLSEKLRLDRARKQPLALSYAVKYPIAILDDVLEVLIPPLGY